MVKEILRNIKVSKISADNSVNGAINPTQVLLSEQRFISLFPELKDPSYRKKLDSLYCKNNGGIFMKFSQYLYFGDSNPAIVISIDPLYVASYAQDIDCVVLTKFPKDFIDLYNLSIGSRLLSANTYGRWKKAQEDIIESSETPKMWNAFRSLICDFLSEEQELINHKKQSIPEHIWKRCEELAFEYPQKMPLTYRDGNPFLNLNPIMVKGVRRNPMENIG